MFWMVLLMTLSASLSATGSAAGYAQPADAPLLYSEANTLVAEAKTLHWIHGIKEIQLLNRAKTALLELRKTNPDFDHGAADRLLGTLYHEHPFYSDALATIHFSSAIEISPRYPENLITFAEFLEKKGNHSEAKQLAIQALNSPYVLAKPELAANWTMRAELLLAH